MRLLWLLVSMIGIAFGQFTNQYIKELNAQAFSVPSSLSGMWLVEFFSPSCGHCQRFTPTYLKLAQDLSQQVALSNLHFGSVNCQQDSAVCDSQKISGYPTLLLYVDGVLVEEYPGSRDYSELEKYLRTMYAQKLPAAQLQVQQVRQVPVADSGVIDLSSALDGQKNKGFWFVKFFAPWCPHCKKLAPTYVDLAQQLISYRQSGLLSVAEVNCDSHEDICSKYGIKGYPTIKMFKDGEFVADYDGGRDLDSMKSYLLQRVAGHQAVTLQVRQLPSVPVAEEQTVISLDMDFSAAPTAHGLWIVKFFAPWCPHCKHLAPIYEEAAKGMAKERAGKQIGFAEVNCDDHKELCNEHGIQGYPTLKLYFNAKRVDDYNGARTAEAMTTYLQSKIKEYSSAEEDTVTIQEIDHAEDGVTKTAINPYGHVVELSGENFDDLTRSGPWIIEFMAPWCGHCKHMAPTWKQLAKELKGLVNVGIVDSPANPSLQKKFGIRGFPTIKFLQDGEEIEEFAGRGRTLENLKAFSVELADAEINKVSITELDSLIKMREVVFLFLGNVERPGANMQILAKKVSKDADFVFSADPLLFIRFKLEAGEQYLIALKDGKHEIFALKDYTDFSAVKTWVNRHKYPALITLNQHNSLDLFKRNSYILMAFLDITSTETDRHREILKTLAESASGTAYSNTLFAWVDARKFSRYAKDTFSIDTSDLPAIVYIHKDGDEYFLMPKNDDFDGHIVSQFMTDAVFERMASTHVNGRIGGIYKAVHRGVGGVANYVVVNPIFSLFIACIALGALYYIVVRRRWHKLAESYDYDSLESQKAD